jgi:SAM-dependent methyltransferase
MDTPSAPPPPGAPTSPAPAAGLRVTPAPPGWHRFTTAVPPDGDHSPVVVYGTDLPTEADLRLLGPVEGKRVLDLGCGTGHNAVVLASQGAKVIGVDTDTDALAHARERADQAEVRVELHHGNLAELPFLRSDSVDAALSVFALAEVDDLSRLFRQVHRVLKPEAMFVCAFPHPAFAMFDPTAADPLRAARRYDDAAPRPWTFGRRDLVDQPRTVGEIFTTFQRTNFLVDHVLEPTATGAGHHGASYAELMRVVPATLILRARKQGN